MCMQRTRLRLTVQNISVLQTTVRADCNTFKQVLSSSTLGPHFPRSSFEHAERLDTYSGPLTRQRAPPSGRFLDAMVLSSPAGSQGKTLGKVL